MKTTFNNESRSSLGGELPVLIYRLLEYSIKDELIRCYGKDAQIEIFRNEGRKSGEFFAKNMLNPDQPLNSFVSELQTKMLELKIGILRIDISDIIKQVDKIMYQQKKEHYSSKTDFV